MSTFACSVSHARASETRSVLKKRGFVAKKSLGQNFVVDDALLRRVVEHLRLEKDEPVLEVGPGTGNLTRHLLRCGARVLAVEKDDRLVESLKEDFAAEASDSRLELVHADVLSWLSDCDSQVYSHAQGRCRVVANLPYNVTSDILKKILPRGDIFSDLHLMLQEEAGKRLVNSKPGDRDYRAMSVRIGYYCSSKEYCFRVGRESYFPRPHVDSCVVGFALRTPEEWPVLEDENHSSFVQLVQRAFLSRRKVLRNALAPLHRSEDVLEAISHLGWHPDVRPSTLSATDYVHLYNVLHKPKDASF